MDIGKLINDKYYRGYEGEEEVVFKTSTNQESLHIWAGYLDDILDKPYVKNTWEGFTRDFQECINAFSDENEEVILNNLEEYIRDIKQYCGRKFSYNETSDCLLEIINFLNKAEQKSQTVYMSVF